MSGFILYRKTQRLQYCPVWAISFTATQSQKAVTAYFLSKQLLTFGFALQNDTPILLLIIIIIIMQMSKNNMLSPFNMFNESIAASGLQLGYSFFIIYGPTCTRLLVNIVVFDIIR